jgi:5-methylcytosine-specific restriction endonuclease McrBC regulatory subunit McrC
MQISEFIQATSQLEKYFKKDYTEQQRQIMFEQLKDLSIEQYQNAIHVAFGKCKFLPRVAELKEYSKENSKQRFKHLYKNLEWCEMYLDEY